MNAVLCLLACAPVGLRDTYSALLATHSPLLATKLAIHSHFADMDASEWALVIAAILVSVWSIWRSVGYALRPGENEPDHIKRSILDDEPAIRVQAAPAALSTAPSPVPPRAVSLPAPR